MPLLLPTNLQSKAAASKNWIRDQNHNQIDDLLEQATDNYVDILIDFSSAPTPSSVLAIRSAASLAGGELSEVFHNVNGAAIRHVAQASLASLLQIPGVAMIEKDVGGRGSLDVSARAIKARSGFYSPNTTWSLSWITRPSVPPILLWSGYTGYGINIAIIDTGVDDEHVSLSGKFVAGYDALNASAPTDGSANPDDDNTVNCGTYHGTHVASIAMAQPFFTWDGVNWHVNDTYLGVAPRARLIDIKALDSSCGFTGANMIKAIDWAIDHRSTAWPGVSSDYYGIDVLSISSSTFDYSDGSDLISQAVNSAVSHGLVVVAAMGNNGPNNSGMGAPAAADGAIAVANVDDQGTVNRTDDSIYSSSSRGPRASDGDADQYDEMKPDVAAPGTDIMAARGGNPASNKFFEKTGTSMSTPHVAGVAALMLESRPTLTPSQIKDILRITAEDRSSTSCPTYNSSLSSKYDVCYGWGIVDAWRASHAIGLLNVTLGLNSPPNHGWTPPHAYNELVQLHLSTNATEGVSLVSFTVKASGTGNDASDIMNVTFTLDENANGEVDSGETNLASGQYPSDDSTLKLTLKQPYNLSASTSSDFIISYKFGSGATNGETYRLNLTSIEAAGLITLQTPDIIGLPLLSTTTTVVAPTLITPLQIVSGIFLAALVMAIRSRQIWRAPLRPEL